MLENGHTHALILEDDANLKPTELLTSFIDGAIEEASQHKFDVLYVSRNSALAQVKRVISKACPGAPHEVLLVLDATNGQNAIAQARQFHEALGVTGIVLAKLDGTAKGGVVIGICDELKLPVRYVGVGEKVADLRPFSPHEFVEALFGEGP